MGLATPHIHTCNHMQSHAVTCSHVQSRACVCTALTQNKHASMITSAAKGLLQCHPLRQALLAFFALQDTEALINATHLQRTCSQTLNHISVARGNVGSAFAPGAPSPWVPLRPFAPSPLRPFPPPPLRRPSHSLERLAGFLLLRKGILVFLEGICAGDIFGHNGISGAGDVPPCPAEARCRQLFSCVSPLG